MFHTPILFIIFNRPEITKRTFEQIKNIKPKKLFIAADGPRLGNNDDINKCKETRKVIEQIDWDCELKTLFREINLGCGTAVSSAISWFFQNSESGIILEDDCFPNLSFFPYCEELLIKYQNVDKIKFIGGNNFQKGNRRGDGSYYFSHYPASWGWATWRRSWEMFNHDISNSPEEISNGSLSSIFNTGKEKSYWTNILKRASAESTNVWDFHFYYAIWKNKGICITPNKNLVINLGFFDHGTHYFLKDSTKTDISCETIDFPLIHPNTLDVDREADHFTFENLYSHSIKRSLRIIKENDLYSFYKYIKHRIEKAL